MGADGKVSDVSVASTNMTGTFENQKTGVLGKWESKVSNVEVGETTTVGYNASTDGDKVSEMAQSDGVVSGMSDLVTSNNVSALMNQSGDLPGLS